MYEKEYGTVIEGFVQRSYDRMFDNKIEVRHHPLTGWSQATISGNQSNFSETKSNVLRTLEGVQHTLYHERDKNEVLTELSEFQQRAESAESVDDLGVAIVESRSILDRAFNR